MDYMTAKEAASIWDISDRRVLQYCNSGRMVGAVKMGNTWLIPKSVGKPADRRWKSVKSKENRSKEITRDESI